jgi:hypothetical protein
LDYDSNYSSGYNQYLNRDVFILQYSKNGVEIANGKINEILQENTITLRPDAGHFFRTF